MNGPAASFCQNAARPWRTKNLSEIFRTLLRGVTAVLAVTGAIAGCHREARDLHPNASTSAQSSGVAVGDLQVAGLPPAVATNFTDDYQENAYAMNEGQRLFESYNCTGCHAHGGGAIGPALMDERWIYGSAPANIFATIVEGRPNGMPSFRGRIPDFQVAELVAYVRSLAGLAGKISAPGREEHMAVKNPENTLDPQPELSQEASALP